MINKILRLLRYFDYIIINGLGTLKGEKDRLLYTW